MNASCAKHARHYSLHHTIINKAHHSVEQTSVSFNSFPSMVPYMGPIAHIGSVLVPYLFGILTSDGLWR